MKDRKGTTVFLILLVEVVVHKDLRYHLRHRVYKKSGFLFRQISNFCGTVIFITC